MLTITRLNARGKGNSSADVLRYLMEHELSMGAYYVGHGDQAECQTSRWLGGGAGALGLDGRKVELADMGRLADGFDPVTGRALCSSAGKQQVWHEKKGRDGKPIIGNDGKPIGYFSGGHRIGFDCTFSAPKSVSLLFANADDAERQQIIAAHCAAVDRTFRVMEDIIETRRGKGGVDVHAVKSLVASGHTHFGNRELEPQLHEHVIVYNVCEGDDGKWATFDAAELYRNQRMLGALYRAELAREMTRLGYGIDQRRDVDADGNPTGEIYWDIAGVSREACDHFSTRHKQVVEHLAEHGGYATDASLATRKRKEEPSYDELTASWHHSLDEFRVAEPELAWGDNAELHGRQGLVDPQRDSDIIRQLHERDAVFSREDVIAALAREHAGRMGIDGVLREAGAFLERNDLVRIAPEPPDPEREQHGSRRQTQPRYAARWWIDGIEGGLFDTARERRNDESVRVAPENVASAIEDFQRERGFALSEEQRHAVEYLASGTGGVGILTGRAGTGKTTTTDALVRAMRADGREVIGCSTSWAAARKLEAETNMPSYSTARLLTDLDRGKTKLNNRSVVIMDEAGMAGTVDIARLARHVNTAGGKLILEGDAKQLQAVDAGGAFRLLAKELGDAQLTDIRRQKDPRDRAIVERFYAKPKRGGLDREHEEALRDALGGIHVADPLRLTEEVIDAISQGRFDDARHKVEHINYRQSHPALDAVEAAICSIDNPNHSDTARKRGQDILGMLESRNLVDHNTTKAEAVDALVKDYLASPTTGRQKMVIAGKRADVARLNSRLRDGLRQRGDITGPDHTFSAVVDGKRRDVALAVGDRIRFSARHDPLGIVNGTQAVIESIDDKGVHARIQSDIAKEDGKAIVFDPAKVDHFAHAYATTVHKSQGQTVTEAYHLADVGMTDSHLSLVAASRARSTYRLYGAEGDLENLAERLGRDRFRSNAMEEGRHHAEPAPTAEQRKHAIREAAQQIERSREIQRERHRHRIAIT